MRYLKIYEEYYDIGYSEITPVEFYQEIGPSNFDFVSYTERDKSLLLSVMDDKKIFSSIKFFGDRKNLNKSMNGYTLEFVLRMSNLIRIWKKEDEWFYVSIGNKRHYKCDQINGVIDFINKKLIKKF